MITQGCIKGNSCFACWSFRGYAIEYLERLLDNLLSNNPYMLLKLGEEVEDLEIVTIAIIHALKYRLSLRGIN